MSTLGARSVSLHHDGVCTKHLFGHLRTMMTRANSLRSREAGSPINVSVTQGPTPIRGSGECVRMKSIKERDLVRRRATSSSHADTNLPGRVSCGRRPKFVDTFRTAVFFEWAAYPANLFILAELVGVGRYAAVTSQLRIIPSLTPSHTTLRSSSREGGCPTQQVGEDGPGVRLHGSGRPVR